MLQVIVTRTNDQGVYHENRWFITGDYGQLNDGYEKFADAWAYAKEFAADETAAGQPTEVAMDG